MTEPARSVLGSLGLALALVGPVILVFLKRGRNWPMVVLAILSVTTLFFGIGLFANPHLFVGPPPEDPPSPERRWPVLLKGASIWGLLLSAWGGVWTLYACFASVQGAKEKPGPTTS